MAQPDYLGLLAQSPVFAGVPGGDLPTLLEDLQAVTHRFVCGESVRRAGEELDFYPVVLAGRVQATMLQGGQNRIVAQFNPGDSFAEAVPAALKCCPVDIWAVGEARILCLPAVRLKQCSNLHAKTVQHNLTNELSKKIGVLSRTLAVLGEPRLSDRILAYLDTLQRNEDGTYTVPYSRQEWAGVLRVADKSLIRELRSMQEAGIIEVDGRIVRVLRTM